MPGKKFDITAWVNELAREAEADARPSADDSDLPECLKGRAIELWSDAAGGRLFIVADEADAARLNQRRGEVLTADELRMVIQITDPEAAAEVLHWKRTFDGCLRARAPEPTQATNDANLTQQTQRR